MIDQTQLLDSGLPDDRGLVVCEQLPTPVLPVILVAAARPHD